MSDAIEQSVTRDEVKPLKDWRKIIAASSLPDESKRMIEQVVRKTRLWKRERASVARELIAHFHDADDAGVASAEAIRRFGDAKQAARLIRRAKIRNRSYLWHARRFVQRVIGVLILFYIGLGIYYYMGKPSPSVDYIAKLNASVLATPESDWAWPIYRDAAFAIKADPTPDANWPEDDGWEKTVAWLEAHQGDIQTLRTAAAKPALGLPLSHTLTPEDASLFSVTPNNAADGVLKDALVTVYIPHLNHMRAFANALGADAARGIELGQADRVRDDIVALYRMSDQLRRRDMLVTDLVAIGIRSMAQRAMSNALYDAPELFSDQTLLEFAHRDSSLRVASDLISFKGERYLFYDLIQRTYTDDGEGDGRITPEAMRVLTGSTQPEIIGLTETATRSDDWLQKPLELTLSPAVLLLSASRKDLVAKYDQMMDASDNRLTRNARDLGPDQTDDALNLMKQSAVESVRYAVLTVLMPALNRGQYAAERVLATQEGLRVAIALELYRRAHESYPKTLDSLVPQYLPEIPPDRITGEPLCYVITDGKPRVYSRGMDRDDDGGVVPISRGEPSPWLVAIGGADRDGDWVLFPVK